MITIAGKPCSGKSATSKYLEKEHNFERISMGDMFRSIATEYGINVNDLNQKCNNLANGQNQDTPQIDIDAMLDKRVQDLGSKRIREYIILESRTGFKLIPQSYKVYTTITPQVQAQRLLHSGRTTEDVDISAEQAIINLDSRENMERERFLRLYKADIMDLKQYDKVVDTSNITIAQGGESVLEGYIEYRKARNYDTDSNGPTLTFKRK